MVRNKYIYIYSTAVFSVGLEKNLGQHFQDLGHSFSPANNIFIFKKKTKRNSIRKYPIDSGL